MSERNESCAEIATGQIEWIHENISLIHVMQTKQQSFNRVYSFQRMLQTKDSSNNNGRALCTHKKMCVTIYSASFGWNSVQRWHWQFPAFYISTHEIITFTFVPRPHFKRVESDFNGIKTVARTICVMNETNRTTTVNSICSALERREHLFFVHGHKYVCVCYRGRRSATRRQGWP